MRLSVLGLMTAGLALLSGCSDPVPPTPRGAWTVSFVDTGAACQHKGHNTKVGDVGPSTKNAVVVDGTEGADVDCSVKASGAGFAVDASLTQNASGLSVLIGQIAPSATDMAPAQGAISYVSPETVDAYLTPPDSKCDFYFVPGGQGVAAGRVWLSFGCHKVEAEGSVCESMQTYALQGYAIFENCSE